MIKPTTTTQNKIKRPPEHSPKRRCRCSDCAGEINAMTSCFRINGRNVCESCGPQYQFNPVTQRWDFVSQPITDEKPRMGRPPLGDAACEVRWHAKATHAEDAMLLQLATEHTGGNKSEFLRLAVRTLASKNINLSTTQPQKS